MFFLLFLLSMVATPSTSAEAQTCGLDPLVCCQIIAPEHASFNVDTLYRATSEPQIQLVRNRLLNLVWPSIGKLPTRRPILATDISYTVDSNDFVVVEGVGSQIDTTSPPFGIERIDKLLYAMVTPAGVFSTTAWLFVPLQPNGRGAIVHQGHSSIPGALRVSEVVRDSVNLGFHVVWMGMAGRTPNTVPPGLPDYALHVDSDYEALESPTFHPLSLFLEPEVAVVNYLESLGLSEINWIGHSGGGWTGVWMAALDTRINRLFENAGSQPEYLDQATTNCSADSAGSDYEQQHSERDFIASMIDLYVMAASGEGRAYHSYRNQYDNCCFKGPKFLTYSTKVEDWVDDLQVGEYTSRLESIGQGHAVHSGTRADIRVKLSFPVQSSSAEVVPVPAVGGSRLLLLGAGLAALGGGLLKLRDGRLQARASAVARAPKPQVSRSANR